LNEAQAAKREQQAEFLALTTQARPELHRYCARLMGSVLDGEDVVQDTFVQALAALPELDVATPLRLWLFRIAHNRAIDLLRGRAIRKSEPIDIAMNLPDVGKPDPEEMALRQEALTTAVSRFTELPVLQRSVVILKDVLGQSLGEIAVFLAISVDAVKGHLARGRARLREANATPPSPADMVPASADTARYVSLFNKRDWDALRALLAEDVQLAQSTYPRRRGRSDVGMFFTMYANWPEIWLAPAWLEGREVIAVYENRTDAEPGYFMWLEWRDGRISFIHDYRYVRYVADDVKLRVTR
jgi:RNA polymerase sigma-70 factor, ECF subfamily